VFLVRVTAESGAVKWYKVTVTVTTVTEPVSSGAVPVTAGDDTLTVTLDDGALVAAAGIKVYRAG
jgi:hypothetical protein